MNSYKIYFAGGLFDHKELIGNLILAEAIERCSEGAFKCVLPQNLEQIVERAVEVRNQDLLHVMECDLALFNFDGTDLDSGTVVEFMLAKMLDIPSVILRTDFRASGDQLKDNDPWNLMCSGYPRTAVVIKHSMAEYQKVQRISGDSKQIIETLYTPLAHEIIKNFHQMISSPSLFNGDKAEALRIYRWTTKFPGESLRVPANWCEKLVEYKNSIGLI